MNDRTTDGVWNMKGGTFSDKSARREFGLTQEEIIKAINRGHLRYRVNSMHGNPFLRLIRSEVEAFVTEKYGGVHLKQKKTEAELAQINEDLRRLAKEVAQLRTRKAKLQADLESLMGQRDHRTVQSRRGR